MIFRDLCQPVEVSAPFKSTLHRRDQPDKSASLLKLIQICHRRLFQAGIKFDRSDKETEKWFPRSAGGEVFRTVESGIQPRGGWGLHQLQTITQADGRVHRAPMKSVTTRVMMSESLRLTDGGGQEEERAGWEDDWKYGSANGAGKREDGRDRERGTVRAGTRESFTEAAVDGKQDEGNGGWNVHPVQLESSAG